MAYDWNLEGALIEAMYLNEQYIVGRVESSRVAYGGAVKHTVVLDKPVTFSWSSEPRTRLIVDDEMITSVFE